MPLNPPKNFFAKAKTLDSKPGILESKALALEMKLMWYHFLTF
ncbi:hypothetical protein BGP_1750 [Beggiatoa sp. PS]|nr:hypothetical protein BGP_1750 [Beggiatoa sp. PS]